jgi:hypothetical protein
VKEGCLGLPFTRASSQQSIRSVIGSTPLAGSGGCQLHLQEHDDQRNQQQYGQPEPHPSTEVVTGLSNSRDNRNQVPGHGESEPHPSPDLGQTIPTVLDILNVGCVQREEAQEDCGPDA